VGSFYVGLRKGCPYWSQIDDYVYLGALPTRWHAGSLRRLEVKAVVNMCDEDVGPVDLYKQLGIEQLWLPTIDHLEPSIDSVRSAVKFIEEHVASKQKVLIHCMVGIGRSAAVAICWLAHRHKDIDLVQLNTLLSSKRCIVRSRLYSQPLVKQYYSEEHGESQKEEHMQ